MNKSINLVAFLLLFAISSCGKKNESKQVLKQTEVISLTKGNYIVNKLDSKLVWKGKEVSTKEHDGTLNIRTGSVLVDNAGNINGNIEIDMESINVTDLEGEWKKKLEGHLTSPDFFGVKSFPTAIIKFKGNKNKATNGEIKFKGDLTIKKITHPIMFSGKLVQKGLNVIVTAPVSFDRSKYDVKYGSGTFFDNLGDKLIYDEINVKVTIVAQVM